MAAGARGIATSGSLQTRLREIVRGTGDVVEGDMLLERAVAAEPPRVMSAEVLEGGELRARAVRGTSPAVFRAFLDGTQSSRPIAHSHGVPIVEGTVAAVIRERRNRRMVTWHRPTVARRLYAPLAALPAHVRDALPSLGLEIVDTTPSAGAEERPHPFALQDAAVHRVQEDRERAEQALAVRWCSTERDPICIDGGISGSEAVAVSTCTVGAVKSHRTLYVDGDAMRRVLALARGERSSVLRVTSRKRTTVASWYLRLRDAAGHDPMFGLVRIEIAMPAPAEAERLTERADEVSRWMLAEASPLALPDARWDRMLYGIRDCEEFLRAIT